MSTAVASDTWVVSRISSGSVGGSYGIVDAGKVRDFASPCPSVEALAVPPFTLGKRGGHVDFDEAIAEIPDRSPGLGIRRDQRAHDGDAVLFEAAGQKPDPADVGIPIFRLNPVGDSARTASPSRYSVGTSRRRSSASTAAEIVDLPAPE